MVLIKNCFVQKLVQMDYDLEQIGGNGEHIVWSVACLHVTVRPANGYLVEYMRAMM